ncbi:hypothetical protein [Hymenobacter profundi]|uniref:DUF4303 domain-containing protein n=1 Tax=Hymenobacter profundi TaxID=1982110 RepID=A0ABS6X143_9BACT|nr:hypothetical protein [Hymenobacter profundi]MBW3129409.1 hypothetical protein [Hymenobacter profundi]
MDFALFDSFQGLIQEGKLKEAIAQAECKLRSLETTYFHVVLGTSILYQQQNVMTWLDAFYQSVSPRMPVGALYVEMNAFDINTEEWYFDGFAYEEAGTREDAEWLTNWSADTTTEEHLVLGGFESVQEAFETYFYEEKVSENLEQAHDVAEILVILRIQELLEEVHQVAESRGLAWGAIPLLVTAHGYDLLHQIK